MVLTMDGFTGSAGATQASLPAWAHWLGLVAAACATVAFAVAAWSSALDLQALLDAPPPPGEPLEPLAAAVLVPEAVPAGHAAPSPSSEPALPELLSQTGLYSGAAGGTFHADVVEFSPQYPLWSDGATKQRFLRLPPGTTIDGSDPDAWVFPVGTRFWKEFSFERRVETRYIERRADGSWAFASYVWDEAGHEARLAPELGVRGVAALPAVSNQPRALRHDIPCHEGGGARAPILGFSALQLSGDRDPSAPHAELKSEAALDLERLLARGLLVGYPKDLARPRIHAESPEARATLGYLHGNCSGCHNRSGALSDLGLDFEERVGDADSTERVLASVQSAPSRFRLPGQDHSLRVAPGAPEQSVVSFRMGSRNVAQQMPPLGSKVVDPEATALVAAWIEALNHQRPTAHSKESP
jgi:hypothetical protein